MNQSDIIGELRDALRRINTKANDGAIAGGIDETVALEDIADISGDALDRLKENPC
jgi:hypothetical protein